MGIVGSRYCIYIRTGTLISFKQSGEQAGTSSYSD